MFRRTKLSTAVITAIAAGITGGSGAALSQGIEEIIVTSTKTEASTQDIPLAVSALTSEKLDQMGVSNFEDYLVQLPGVTAGGSGPGQNTIYIRGVASTTPTISVAGVSGLAPNVAFYLDEQPLAQPGRNLDIYAADLSRVEVLAGPQGTLYGSSSQSGTVRLITNKPDPSEAYGKIKLDFGSISGGEGNEKFEAMYNLPVSDRITLRGVVYRDKKGGYIDNVHGTQTLEQSARFRVAGFMRSNGIPVGSLSAGRAGFNQSVGDIDGDGYADMPSAVNFEAADNAALVEEDFNDTKYEGARISALVSLSDDWELLVSHTNQDLDSDGVFFADPNVGDLQVQRYANDYIEDEIENTNWTLKGRLGSLDVIYTGAFTERGTNSTIGYTDYMFVGQYLPYYICDASVIYPGDNPRAGTCYSPELFVASRTGVEVETHEFRITTDQEKRLRLTAGAFMSDTEVFELNDFTYPSSVHAQGPGPYTYIESAPFQTVAGPGWSSYNYSYQTGPLTSNEPFPAGVIFRNDILRTDEQKGYFGELSYDVNDQISVTAGARYYDIEVDFDGSANGSYGTFCGANNEGCQDFTGWGGNDITAMYGTANPSTGIDKGVSDGTITKFTMSYTPNDNILLYGTVSEGFRSGFMNRPGGRGNDFYTVPYAFGTDDLTNYEIGWKTDLLDGSMRLNGSAFFAEIEGLQTTIFDPSIDNLFFSDNAANAEVSGLEADLIWMPTSIEGLTVTGAISLLETEITAALTTSRDVVVGDSLAFAPETQLNLQARYEWDLDSGLLAHIMPYMSYSDESYSDIVRINRALIDSWTMMGFTAGVTGDNWAAELYIDNLTDERAELSRNYVQDRDRVTYATPRTFGLRVTFEY